jgi:hypothetical protein
VVSLKLGRLPDRKTTKLTFTASADLSELLTEYAAAYERQYGQDEAVVDLIPHMLEAFIRADRGFKKKDVSSKTSTQNNNTND